MEVSPVLREQSGLVDAVIKGAGVLDCNLSLQKTVELLVSQLVDGIPIDVQIPRKGRVVGD